MSQTKESVLREITIDAQKSLRFPMRKREIAERQGDRAIAVNGKRVPLSALLDVVPVDEFRDARELEGHLLENWMLAEAGARSLRVR